MSKGIDAKDVFKDDKLKVYFLGLLHEKVSKLKIKLFAYCLMDTHYHLIIQNSFGNLSGFTRQLNGLYGSKYRKIKGGKGYVFQGRYKSTLIQNEQYLLIAIIYVLFNPVRSGLVEDPFKYKWSSINEYFNEKETCLVDKYFVEDILQSKETMKALLTEWYDKELPIINTRYGSIMGNDDFEEKALKKYDRRKQIRDSLRRRKNDYIFEPPEEVIDRFEFNKNMSVDDIKTNTLNGKQLRSELLLLLKDRSGLTYKEIMTYPIFKSLKHSSLAKLYQKAKMRIEDR
ncbi:MAG: transposase [Spirochaetota bacterium]|nr:MAG: transposase [Spirochaetota bacterium]